DALKPTPRGERPCVPKARLAGWGLADQVQPVRRHCRGAKQRAAGMGCIVDPLESKRSAQPYEGGGVSDESPRGARRCGGSMPGTTARTGCAGRRKDNSGRIAELPKCEASDTRNSYNALRFKLLIGRVTESTGFEASAKQASTVTDYMATIDRWQVSDAGKTAPARSGSHRLRYDGQIPTQSAGSKASSNASIQKTPNYTKRI
ncbi:MAG: hypothetical protein ACTS6J_24345, partial [Burkholderiales bacterium]